VIHAEVVFDIEGLARLNRMIAELPVAVLARVEDKVVPVARRLARRLLAVMPGKPKYPIRWTSERQRRYVLGYVLKRDSEGHIIPYERSGKLTEAWDVLVQVGSMAVSYGVPGPHPTGLAAMAGLGQQAGRGDFALVLFNPAPMATYVQGKRQQLYHRDTGWPNVREVAPVIAREVNPLIVMEWKDVTGGLFRGIKGI
jgi:hypothetical protein